MNREGPEKLYIQQTKEANPVARVENQTKVDEGWKQVTGKSTSKVLSIDDQLDVSGSCFNSLQEVTFQQVSTNALNLVDGGQCSRFRGGKPPDANPQISR